MPVYAWNSVISGANEPMVVIDAAVTDGHTLVYDAAVGKFVNKTGAESFGKATNLGSGVPVYAGYDLTNGIKLKSFTGVGGIVVTNSANEVLIDGAAISGGTSAATVVNTIPDRDALTPILGRLVLVQSGTDSEFEVYICTNIIGPVYQLIGTQDSSIVDAQTISEFIAFNAATGSYTIGNISPFREITSVVVEVQTAFDGFPSLTVGDDTNGPINLMNNSDHDLGSIGSYELVSLGTPNSGASDLALKLYFTQDPGSTQGQAKITITFS